VAIVSVILTTIKRPVLVQRALKSALKQTLSDIEIVVVIDGPDPETVSVLEEVRDSRLRVLPLSENVGLAEARNVGVRNAIAEWVAFLDDDDEWFSTKLDMQVSEARRLGCHEVFIAGRYIEKASVFERVWPEVLPGSREAFSEYMFVDRGQLIPSTYFVSKSLVLKIPFCKGLRFIEDVDWLLRVAAEPAVEISCIDEPVAIYYNFADPNRESLKCSWEVYYNWAVSRRRLFTGRAFSLYLVKSVLSRARENRAPLRDQLRILYTAIVLGRLRFEVLFYFIASALFGRDAKKRVRDLTLKFAHIMRPGADGK